jgi:hypothetical protein
MKKGMFFFFPAILSLAVQSQQPPVNDLEKLLRQAQKGQPADNPLKSMESGNGFKAPKKNTALLAAIPKKLFTLPELSQYVKTLVKKFEASPGNKKAIAFVKKNYPYKNKKDYQQLFVLLWYKGRQNEAIYVALQAAAAQTNDLLVLNNFCALLNMSGYPHKAIPILKYALKQEPTNTLLLNNTGQAYYQLGDLATSSGYLSSCTRIDPYHVEANNTQGHIATAQGNMAAANSFYENSIKGGYNQSAAEQLQSNNPDRSVADLVNWPTPDQYPETDDNIPFQCPDIPTDVTQNPVYEAKRQEEADAWSRAQEEYRTRINESMERTGREMMASLMSGGRPVVTMGIMHDKAGLAFGKAYTAYFDQLNRLNTEYAAWKEEFDHRWHERMKDACLNASSEACCGIMRGLESQKQQEWGQRYAGYCTEMWANARGHYNCIAYWKPYFIKEQGIFNRELFTGRLILLGTASNLTGGAGVDFSALCLEAVEPGVKNKEVNFKEPECTIVKIPLGVGGFELGCDKFKASFGEGIIGEIELNFKTFQSTLAFGVGGQVQSGLANASAGALNYITFDGDFNITDWGRRVQGSVGLVEISGDLGLNALSSEASLSVGVNSGVNSSVSINAFNQTMFGREANLYSFSQN